MLGTALKTVSFKVARLLFFRSCKDFITNPILQPITAKSSGPGFWICFDVDSVSWIWYTWVSYWISCSNILEEQFWKMDFMCCKSFEEQLWTNFPAISMSFWSFKFAKIVCFWWITLMQPQKSIYRVDKNCSTKPKLNLTRWETSRNIGNSFSMMNWTTFMALKNSCSGKTWLLTKSAKLTFCKMLNFSFWSSKTSISLCKLFL